MKKILILLLTLFLSANVFAQRMDKKKLKALKIAHITEQLNLTEKEAQAFWPIYNANEDAKEKLQLATQQKHMNRDFESLTEDEAKKMIEDHFKREEAQLKQERAYFLKLNKVLSAKKILILKRADHTFKRRMIKEFRERHKERNKRKP